MLEGGNASSPPLASKLFAIVSINLKFSNILVSLL
jgi:hypothetical protein